MRYVGICMTLISVAVDRFWSGRHVLLAPLSPKVGRCGFEAGGLLLANSLNVAAKIQKLYGRQATVIHPPVDLKTFRLGGRQEPYYLIVSAFVPYKRIDIAIRAFNEMRLPLKIVGQGPWRSRLERSAGSTLNFLVGLTSRSWLALYGGCQALIFPGEEDFGIVPLEAQPVAGRSSHTRKAGYWRP